MKCKDMYGLQGYHGDTSATFYCGDVDDEAKKLVQVPICLHATNGCDLLLLCLRTAALSL